MIELRYLIFLSLWTMLIGPVLDFSASAPSAQAPRAKTAPEKPRGGR